MAARDEADEARLRIGILALPRFTLSVLGMFLDPVRLAADEADHSRQVRCRWDVITLNGQPVDCSLGLSIRPTATLGSLSACDLVVVAGGVLPRLRGDRAMLSGLLQKLHASGKTIIGLCTGAFWLVEAGLIAAEDCAVSEFHLDDLTRLSGRPITEPSHKRGSGRLITASTGQGAAELALSVIRDRLSGDLAEKSARILKLPHDAGAFVARPPLLPEPQSDVVRRALRVLEDTLSDPITMAAVARRLDVTTRQLERLFKRDLGVTAFEAREALRVRHAVHLLAETDLPLIDVARACGFVSSTALNRAFSRAGERLPREIRASRKTRGSAAA